MKATEILSEELDELSYKKIAKLILTDCSPFLEQIEYHPDRLKLFRGLGDQAEFVKLQQQANRTPRDTRQEVHRHADAWFNQSFGHKYRSDVTFATGSRQNAEEYGEVFTMFPIGHFSFCWSPIVEDFTFDLINRISMNDMTDPATNRIDPFLLRREVYSRLNSARYQTTDLKAAIVSRCEIMLNCTSYYLVKKTILSGVLSEIEDTLLGK